jgi:kynurenine formamidase
MTNMVNLVKSEDGKRTPSAPRDIRFVVMLTAKEEADIRAYRFANRIDTKAEAARNLIERGLEAVGFRNPETKTATSELAGSN